ncbi:MAG: shikimate dehydrogenase [Chroococcales cyanobacterium]
MGVITGKTKLLGVIGNPVTHSLSPVMHNAAIAALNVDYVYLAFPVKPEALATAIAGFEAIELVGFNITIPHKQTIMPLLSDISPAAKMIGAVNTVWRTETGWYGTNTDVNGFIAPLKTLERDWSQVTPVILGNGGAARAVVVGCHQLGCPQICVVGRNQSKLEHFKQSWENTPIEGALSVHSWDELSGLVSKTGLLVNTTPVGMSPQIEQSPVAENVMVQLSENAIAYDLIYNPRPTLFLKQAAQQGAMAIDGLEMLVQQGAAALEIWLRQPIPVDIMRQSLNKE